MLMFNEQFIIKHMAKKYRENKSNLSIKDSVFLAKNAYDIYKEAEVEFMDQYYRKQDMQG